MDEGVEVKKNHLSVDQVFRDFKARRAGIIKALTTDVEEFSKQCNPDSDDILCLYGLPNGEWLVSVPRYIGDDLTHLPEPTVGINVQRDDFVLKDWLHLIAMSSDSWLLAVAFFLGTRNHFGKAQRSLLFSMINDLPTIREVVTGSAAEKQSKGESTISSQNTSTSKSICTGQQGSELGGTISKGSQRMKSRKIMRTE